MKYSYKWLKEISCTKKNPEDLMKMVGLKGFELENFENFSTKYEKIVVGEILEFHAHPNANNLRLVKVGLGKGKETQIVCGASNFEVWDKIPVALIGAIVPLNGMKIKRVDLRGEFSEGMLCSEEELCLGKDSSGIMILDEKLAVGISLAEALGLDDVVMDFDVLPNRAHDCLSHIGIAREICVMEGTDLKNVYFDFKDEIGNDNLNIDIQNKEACPRYSAVILENIEIVPSPSWMQSRLIASGMEPINNVVDITNYVMLETGSPLHAFDFNNIANEEGQVEIEVRNAFKDEKMTLLDGKELKLDERDLVIANKQKNLALAGIKGGLESGINKETTKIVLEAASFKAFSIRKSRQRHGLSTESQIRFEKAISPKLSGYALARATELLKEYATATAISFKDQSFFGDKDQFQRFSFDYANKLLGEKIENKEMTKIISNLGFETVREDESSIEVKVPFWRLDIEGEADLVEEVGRIVGYDNIDISSIKEDITPAKNNNIRKFEWELIGEFNGLGFDEVRLYSFYSKKDAENCGISIEHFEVENPLSEELAFMRVSLLPNLLRSAGQNVKYFSKFSLFELGREYYNDTRGEVRKVSGVLFDSTKKDSSEFYILKGKISALIGKISNKEVCFKAPSNWNNNIYHKTRTAEVFIDGNSVGFVGQINKVVAKKFGIKKPIVAFELDVDSLFVAGVNRDMFTQINKFPDVLRDLSMFVDAKKEATEIFDIIKKTGGELLRKTELFDVYEDVENNRKSLAFHLIFNKKDATLESDEVDLLMNKIIDALGSSQVEVRIK